MVHFFESIKEVKNSNLVVLLEENVEELPVPLEKNMLKKIEKGLKEGKNFFYSFYVGTQSFENVYIAKFYTDSKKDIYEFLAENIVKLPKEITLFSSSKHLLKDLLLTSLLARYKFQKYKSEKQKDEINLIVRKKDVLFFEEELKTIENILFARDLGETPTHDLTPEKFAQLIKKIPFKNTKVTIFGPEKIEAMGMGLLKGVGWGSQHKPYFAILERKVSKKAKTIGFVGKGIVFDTGGLNIKTPSPIGGMELMKFDMAGAATVVSVMKELDRKNIHVNIIAAIPLAENSVSSGAMRPSDILTAYNGKTVQILNTDAEGRLVLADAVSYLSKNYKIDRFVTIATLTGMCIMTFGNRYAAMMGDDTELIKKFKEYSEENFEKYWELPFDNFYIEKTKSTIADYDNISPGVLAGTIMGGAFVYNFRENNEKFTHFDIASVADSRSPFGLFAKGVTGFGVQSISSVFESLK